MSIDRSVYNNSAHERSSVYRAARFEAIEHLFDLPLDYDDPSGPGIEIFAREVIASGGRDRPFLVFFQGGPGYEDPRPLSWGSDAWLYAALSEFRVLLLDQRGTGRSSALDHRSLSNAEGRAQADRLRHFRADSIVRDAETIRAALGVERSTVLGESFGGFCVLHYLSTAPDSARRGSDQRRFPP